MGKNLLPSLVWKAWTDGNIVEIVAFNAGLDDCEGNKL